MPLHPDPQDAAWTDWPAACEALCRAFGRYRDLGGWILAGHDAGSVHFESCLDGPTYALLGVDLVQGVARFGTIHMPKQDGGYDDATPLPEAWQVALRRLFEQRFGPLVPRFSSLVDAGHALLPVVEPVRSRWFEGPFLSLPAPEPTEEGAGVEIVWACAGHPLDVLAIGIDRASGLGHTLLLEACLPGLEFGVAELPPLLRADLRATPSGPSWPLEDFRTERLASALEAAAEASLAAAAPPPPVPEPLAQVLALHTPARWRQPGVALEFSGPSWRYTDGVPATTMYGRYRKTGAWVAVTFTPDFSRAEFIDRAMGPAPAERLGGVDVPAALRPALAAAYAAR